VERTEFEKEVLEKNEKIADLKERLQVKFALFSRARSIFSCSRSLSLVSTLYSLLPNLYSLLSRSIYHAKNFSGTQHAWNLLFPHVQFSVYRRRSQRQRLNCDTWQRNPRLRTAAHSARARSSCVISWISAP
jgi:hypothetical protein